MEQIPLHHEASAGDTHKQVTAALPTEVVQCLENARFLHLATCVNNQPYVSLMNYTYLPHAYALPSSSSSPSLAPTAPAGSSSSGPVIVMTTNQASKKTHNIHANPNVSLLVHDWVSHRPMTRRLSAGSARSEEFSAGAVASGAPAGTAAAAAAAPAPAVPATENPSSLAALLLNLNTAAVSSISCTFNGTARLLPAGSAEEAYYRQQHLANNTFDADPVGPNETRIHQQIARGGENHNGTPVAGGGGGGGEDDGDGEEVRVIVVAIRDVRISDWKGHVRDWVLEPAARSGSSHAATAGPNGVL
ncbi:pyridoxamine phosphate oxidase [Niveomyces insectorum RCEF 264]|uniref:Pyridoxamine phosphate oxidase n=1 Tax=Niveomyces insectorum RCEF 264 TaxID=1081102 RepID=A0A167ULJ0_9HYPO|nr:pyridoxamine phosphate oxidase [Niveomyces insectorum RCEF 264]